MNLEEFIISKISELNLPITVGRHKVPVLEVILKGIASGISQKGLSSFRKKYFKTIKPGSKIYTHILELYKVRCCSSCKQISTDLNGYCEKCRKNYYIKNKDNIKLYTIENKERISNNKKQYYIDKKEQISKQHKNYRENNLEKFSGYSAKYRAAKLQRSPKWADLKAIQKFYENCPEGYHVDHIIPLQGKLVSGLHVLDNLQYLLAPQNMSKGNKFEV